MAYMAIYWLRFPIFSILYYPILSYDVPTIFPTFVRFLVIGQSENLGMQWPVHWALVNDPGKLKLALQKRVSIGALTELYGVYGEKIAKQKMGSRNPFSLHIRIIGEAKSSAGISSFMGN